MDRVPATSDAVLVERARGGDRDAFSELVRRFQRPLLARALASTRRIEDADDLVQGAFLRAWKGLRGFRDDAAFAGWIFRILDNLAADRGRRSGREIAGGDEMAQHVQDQAPLADEKLLAEEVAARVRAALAGFPPGRKREIFHLRFVEGLPIQEIAARLGVHTGTVKVHLFRGTRELKRVLAEWEAT